MTWMFIISFPGGRFHRVYAFGTTAPRLLGRKVDLVTRNALRPYIGKRILSGSGLSDRREKFGTTCRRLQGNEDIRFAA